MTSLGSGEPESDDLLEGVYQPLKPTLTVQTSKTQFYPWHKPRKHFIRVRQWCTLVQKLIKTLDRKAGDVLTYLGMPGEDLLDIRTLHTTCADANVRLRYIGFDSTANIEKGELLLSESEVSCLKSIDRRSRVLKDRIESVANEKSMGGRAAETHGPFDVINIDLCDSVANPSKANSDTSYFDAIARLCQLQLRRTEPWLLFLTTRASRDQIHQDTKSRLLKCILDNADKNEGFRKSIFSELDFTQATIHEECEGGAPLDHSKLVNAFSLGIGKWLLRLMMSASPFVRVKMLNSYGYSVEGGDRGVDLISLAFQFEPEIQPRIDNAGLVRVSQFVATKPGESESELAELLIPAVRNIADVDHILATNETVRQKTIQQAAKILTDARYDPLEYEKYLKDPMTWGGKHFVKPPI